VGRVASADAVSIPDPLPELKRTDLDGTYVKVVVSKAERFIASGVLTMPGGRVLEAERRPGGFSNLPPGIRLEEHRHRHHHR